MSLALLHTLNVAAECAAILAAFLFAAQGSLARARVLLYRVAFAVAILAPLALVTNTHKTGLVHVSGPLAMEAVWSGPPANEIAGTATAHSNPVTPSGLLAGLWFGGFLLVAGGFARSVIGLNSAFARGQPAPAAVEQFARRLERRLGLASPVAVRFSTEIPAPCTFGTLRPKVLVPVGTEEASIEAVLAHELCHIRSRDALWLMLGRLACALHWFNPLIWLCATRHRDDIEFVCDDIASRANASRESYLSALVQCARHLAQPVGAGVMMSRRGLAARVTALTKREGSLPMPSLWTKTFACSLAIASAVFLGSSEIVAAHDGAMAERAAAAGNGLIYLIVPAKIGVTITPIGFACWDDASCVAETTLGTNVVLHAKPWEGAAARKFAWTGCTPEAGGETCRLTVSAVPAHVAVRAID